MARKSRKKKSTSIWKILFAAIFIGPILLTNIRITIGILLIVLFFRMPFRRLGSFIRSIFAPSNRSASLESNTSEKPQHQTKRKTESPNLVSKPPQKNVSTEKPDKVTARDSDNPRNKKSNFQNQVQPFGNVPLESNNAALIGVRWVPPGESVIVHDILIPNGMVYVGQKSKNPEWREPSHIDNSLSIGIIQTADYEADSMPYWPSYEWIQPEERAAYLRWLSEGKKAKQVSIGYVFLYFYGLERRLLIDIPTDHFASIERPQIVQEIKRLLTIYGDNRSFFNYATSLLSLIECHDLVLETIPAEPPLLEKGTQIPFLLRLSLGKLVKSNLPIAGNWAYSWWLSHPESRTYTSAKRCPIEFKRLFLIYYKQAYASGIVLKENKTRMSVNHRPANLSLVRENFSVKLDLPEVTAIKSTLIKYERIAEICNKNLERYSRYIGKNPENLETIDALLELPIVLWPDTMRRPLDKIHAMVSSSGHTLAVKFEKLRSLLPHWQRVNKATYSSFARSLSELGLGIEPDPRVIGTFPSDSDTVVLFVDQPNQILATPSPSYHLAALALHLALAVSHADGSIDTNEREVIMCQLENWLHLDKAEKSRLLAHLRWLSIQPPATNGLKKRIEGLAVNDREEIARFMVSVAHADGDIAPSEVKLLEKLFNLLELEQGSLYNKLHNYPSEPVTVRPQEENSTGFSIPKRPESSQPESFSLDFERISEITADSIRVSTLLQSIFQDEVGVPETTQQLDLIDEQPKFVNLNGVVWNLSPEFSEFLRLLATRQEWSRTELEELAKDRSLMLDGTLEYINDAAFEQFEQPFTEGTDPVEINPELIGKLS